MKISLPKLKALLLYFSTHTNTTFLGKVKLMKLFYFLDFQHVKEFGAPVTYDTYVKLEHGPIPSFIKNLIDSAAENIDESLLSDTIGFERPAGTNMYRIIPRRQFTDSDRNYFSESELTVLEKVCSRFGNKNTQYIEDASHKEAAWQNSAILEKIPYTRATEDPDCQVTKEEIETLLSLYE